VAKSDTQEVREDGALVNVVTGLGTANKDRSLYTRVGYQRLLTEVELEELYISGIPRRYVDAIPDEMLRHRVTINVADEEEGGELVKAFDEFLKNIRFHYHLSEVVKLQRLYGGAGLVLFVNDGLEADQPIDVSKIRSFEGCAALSRHELIPGDTFGYDRSQPEYYEITTNQKLTPDQEGPTQNIRIHASRVARFDGLYIPRRRREWTHGWGQSSIQLLWDAFKRYEAAMAGLEQMVGDPDTFVHKVPGLMNMIIAGNEAKLKNRLEVNMLARSSYGGMLLDKEEEVEYLQRTLNNLAQATDPFMKELQAATGWPASILMGESPGGLGKEGRFEERVWAALVEQWQTNYCQDPIAQVFTYIMLAKEGPTRGAAPDGWEVKFPSLFTLTDTEKSAIISQMATADTAYITSGVLTALEVRLSRFGNTEFSLETDLNEVVTDQLTAQQDASHQTTMLSYQAQAEAMMNPEVETPAGPGGTPEPDPAAKTDSVDTFAEMYGHRIRVTHHDNSLPAFVGNLVGPDNQRIDGPDAQPTQMVFGPDQTKPHDYYRTRFARNDELIPGPYMVGFSSINHARKAAHRLFPGHTVAGLSRVPSPERDSLCAAWEAY
jgi:phage-related protein (TIGR01555 family)